MYLHKLIQEKTPGYLYEKVQFCMSRRSHVLIVPKHSSLISSHLFLINAIRTTAEQLQFYVQFCKEHPELQAGKNAAQRPRLLADLWEELSASLNSMRGPTRTPNKWKENLSQWKNQLRCRARKARVERLLTGGGPQGTAISEFEEQALQTVGTISVDGLKGLPQLGSQDIAAVAAPELTPAPEYLEDYEPVVEVIDATFSSSLSLSPLQSFSPPLSKPLFTQKTLPPTPKTSAPPACSSRDRFTTTFPSENLNARAKKTNPDAMMEEALRSLQRREERQLLLMEQTNNLLGGIKDALFAISSALENINK